VARRQHCDSRGRRPMIRFANLPCMAWVVRRHRRAARDEVLAFHEPQFSRLVAHAYENVPPSPRLPHRPGQWPGGEGLLVLQAKNFTDLSHQQPLGHRGKGPPRRALYSSAGATDERSGSDPAITIRGMGYHDESERAITRAWNTRSRLRMRPRGKRDRHTLEGGSAERSPLRGTTTRTGGARRFASCVAQRRPPAPGKGRT
jgi:hypothetical protein